MKMSLNWYQKRLDNKLKLLYTTRSKVVKMKTEKEVLNFSESTNIKQSKRLDGVIKALGIAIKEARDESFSALRTPVIAGGAIRDAMYGLPVNDYDVFLDISKIPEDEQEDVVLLFGVRVVDALQKDPRFRTIKDNTLRGVNSVDYMGSSAKQGAGAFFVFETGEYNPDAVEAYNLEFWEPGGYAEPRWTEIENKYIFLRIQFIGHRDERLSQEDPISFVDGFDYNMVRCLYDPQTSQYKLSDSFMEGVNSKVIEVDNDRPKTRAYSFIGKFGVPTFTVKDTRPKKPLSRLGN